MSNSVRQAHLLPSKWLLRRLLYRHRRAGANAAGVAARLSSDRVEYSAFADRNDPRNWADESGERLHPICDGLPALGLFQKRFISSELGFRKPSPDFYRAIVSDLKADAENILMVGDGLQNDVEGALAVKMNAVLVDRKIGRSSVVDQDVPYGIVRSLTELQGLLS